MQGLACVFPTDTLPALAARPAYASQIWRLKERPATKPLILMGADLAQLVEGLGLSWRAEWTAEAERCWPGPTTLVLPLAGPITEALHPGGTSLGLRVPACSMAIELLHLTGPLATTSVNRSGHPPATTAGAAAEMMPSLSLLGPLPWPDGSGRPSTVMAWCDDGHWEVLRPGGGPLPEAGTP
jgi:L-threonylcarbamoyladenylate synthase